MTKDLDERILKALKIGGAMSEGALEEIIGGDVSVDLQRLIDAGTVLVTLDWKLRLRES